MPKFEIEHYISKEQLEKVKTHINKHKTKYWAGSLVVVAGVTYLVTRNSGVTTKASNKAGIVFGDQIINITTVVKRNGRGHPGYPVMNMITGEWWTSAKACADAEGISKKVLSGHLKGKFRDVNGIIYSWVSLVPTPIAK